MTALVLILIAILIAAALTVLAFHYFNKHDNGWLLLVGVVMFFATGFAAITYAFTVWSWLASESKAQIINREYGTNYTREEIFYASDVIETIREIDRKRFEVNGDLMRKEADE